MTPTEFTVVSLAAAVCVVLFAPWTWGTSTVNNWVAGILLAIFVLAAFVGHVCATVRPDSDDMER